MKVGSGGSASTRTGPASGSGPRSGSKPKSKRDAGNIAPPPQTSPLEYYESKTKGVGKVLFRARIVAIIIVLWSLYLRLYVLSRWNGYDEATIAVWKLCKHDPLEHSCLEGNLIKGGQHDQVVFREMSSTHYHEIFLLLYTIVLLVLAIVALAVIIVRIAVILLQQIEIDREIVIAIRIFRETNSYSFSVPAVSIEEEKGGKYALGKDFHLFLDLLLSLFIHSHRSSQVDTDTPVLGDVDDPQLHDSANMIDGEENQDLHAHFEPPRNVDMTNGNLDKETREEKERKNMFYRANGNRNEVDDYGHCKTNENIEVHRFDHTGDDLTLVSSIQSNQAEEKISVENQYSLLGDNTSTKLDDSNNSSNSGSSNIGKNTFVDRELRVIVFDFAHIIPHK